MPEQGQELKQSRVSEVKSSGAQSNVPTNASDPAVKNEQMVWQSPAASQLITSPFGPRDMSKNKGGGSSYHKGIDLRAYKGTAIVAAAEGKVKSVGGSFNQIEIEHTKDLSTRYLHASAIKTTKGATVSKGETIALSGGKGPKGVDQYNAHLHFEVLKSGTQIDPESFLINQGVSLSRKQGLAPRKPDKDEAAPEDKSKVEVAAEETETTGEWKHAELTKKQINDAIKFNNDTKWVGISERPAIRELVGRPRSGADFVEDDIRAIADWQLNNHLPDVDGKFGGDSLTMSAYFEYSKYLKDHGGESDLNDSRKAEMESILKKIDAKYSVIDQVAKGANVPPAIVAAIWYREASLKDGVYLHNGQDLGKPTDLEPKNVSFGKNEFVKAGIHALKTHKAGPIKLLGLEYNSTDLAAMCAYTEGYNGWGYRKYHNDQSSAYVTAGTSKYTGGKYTSDGKYDAKFQDEQMGTMPIMSEILKRHPPKGSAIATAPIPAVAAPAAANKTEADDKTNDKTNDNTIINGGELAEVTVVGQSKITPLSEKGYVSGTKGSGLRVRSCASTEGDKLGLLADGTKLDITGKAPNGWYQINFQGGIGFVSNKYVTLGDKPVQQPQTTSSNKRNIQYIFVHCTAGHQTDTVADVVDLHVNKMGWSRPGYHYIVSPDGSITNTVDESTYSNGVKGYNSKSVNISYIGGVQKDGVTPTDNRTSGQRTTLRNKLVELKAKYPNAEILGHRNVAKKACPSFDAKSEYSDIKPDSNA